MATAGTSCGHGMPCPYHIKSTQLELDWTLATRSIFVYTRLRRDERPLIARPR